MNLEMAGGRKWLSRAWRGFLFGAMTVGTATAAVAPSAPDHVRVMIHKRSAPSPAGEASTIPIAASVLSRWGAVALDEQQGFILVDLARSSLGGLRAEIEKGAGLAVQERPDFNTVQFSTLPIDSWEPTPIYPIGYGRVGPLTQGARDSFVIQFASVPRPEWILALQDAGVTIIDYVPQNAYTVLGTADALEMLATRLPVQLLRLHQPVHKISTALRASREQFVDVVVVVLQGTEGNLARDFLRTVTLSVVRQPDDEPDRSYLRLRVVTAALPQLASLPGITWIEPLPNGLPSGEREVDVAAGIVSWQYPGILMPGTPGSYPGWLASRGIDPEAASPIGMLDTGWHLGPGSVHNDLRNGVGSSTVTALNYTLDPEGPNNPNTDCTGHGTMVAGILGGNASGPYGSGTQDGNGGYLMGLGMAPGAPIVSGRIFNFSGSTQNYFQPMDWRDIFGDLSARGVKVTNNSWNDTTAEYNTDSTIFDRLVRHSGRTDAYGPMTIVFAAGNRDEGEANAYVTAPANAKNVISVGATQGYNPNTYPDRWATGPYPTAGSSAANANSMWAGSRVGPTYNDGRIKPDLVAAGTGIESARTEFVGSCYIADPPIVGSTIDDSPINSRHLWSRGTSFSSPLTAAASNLLQLKQGAISPAMTKAMLVALTQPLATSDYRPTSDSGWGRLDLSRAFQSTGFYKVDQSVVMTPGSSFFTTNDLTPLDPNRLVRIVLAWTDAAGTPGTGPQLRNNLDLVVYSRSFFGLFCGGNNFDAPTYGAPGWSTTFGLGRFPSWDTVNNVEVVVVPADLGTTFWVEVRNTAIVTNALGLAGGYPPQQDFALFIDNVR